MHVQQKKRTYDVTKLFIEDFREKNYYSFPK